GGVGLHQDRELVASAASGDAGPAHALADPAAERTQGLVTGGMAVAIVDLLEHVDVGDDRRERTPRGARGGERGFAAPAHLLVVVEPREAVVFGLPAVTPAL